MNSLPLDHNTLLHKTFLLLKQILGQNVELADYQILNRQRDYVVMLAKVRNPSIELILKFAGSDAPIACPFEQTAYIHRLVAAQTTIFMPEVIAVDSTYLTWPWRYMVRTVVAGREWADLLGAISKAEIGEAHAQIGDAVAQIHNITLPGYGEFASDGEPPEGGTYLDALLKRIEFTIQSQKLRFIFRQLLEQNAPLFAENEGAALCHEDLHKHNLLFTQDAGQWRLATILDFDKAWAGNPESDLARLALWDGMTGEGFWNAYRARRQVSPLYEIRRPIFQLLWCFEYAKSSEKHLADTNQLCDMLGLPRLAHFD